MPRNRLVVIGPLGCQVAYLNVPREDAIQRYRNAQVCFPGDVPAAPDDSEIREFEFHDAFHVYAAGPCDDDGPCDDSPAGPETT